MSKLKKVLRAKNEQDIPKDTKSRFEEILLNEMDVESWRRLLKWCSDYEFLLFWIQAENPKNGPPEPWPAPLWNGSDFKIPHKLYHKFIEENEYVPFGK